jgi:hypothetical protein
VKQRFEGTFAAGMLVLLLALALTAQFLTPSDEPESGSAVSSLPAGRRALLLLLRDLGFEADAWNEAPGGLPRGGGLVWLARVPEPLPTVDLDSGKEEGASEEKEEESQGEDPAVVEDPAPPSPAARDLRAPAHYRRFLDEGGTMILHFDDDARKFLVEELGLSECEDVHVSRVAPAGVRHVRDSRGEELEVEVEEGGVLVPPTAGSIAQDLWWGGTESSEGEEALATMIPVGSGQVVLLGDDSFLANEKIGERDHALLAVRLVEEFARGGRVLFDEYALGLWRPRTAVGLIASPMLLLATLHIVALLLLGFWRSAWVREFPRDPPALESISPLLRARALASLLVRAGRLDVLARHLREGTRRRISRRSPGASEAMRVLEGSTCASAEELERWNERLKEIECRTS